MSLATAWHLEQGRGLLRSADRQVVVQFDRPSSGLTVSLGPAVSSEHVMSSGHAGSSEKKSESSPETGDPLGTRTCAEMKLLGIYLPDFPDPLPSDWIVDAYVRRNDLITTYERPAPDHFRTQAYWRYVWEEAAEDKDVVGRVDGVQLIVSVQTNRLDLRPSVVIHSEIDAEEVFCLSSSQDDRLTQVTPAGVADDSGEPSHAPSPLWVIRLREQNWSVLLMTLPEDLVRVQLERHGTSWRLAFHLLDEHLEKGVIRRAQIAAWFLPRDGDAAWAMRLYGQLLSAPPPLTT